MGWVARSAQVDQLVAGAIQRYVSDWSRLGAPRLAQQARLWLHLAAAVVAVGLVAGLYQRGLVNAYVAGWEYAGSPDKAPILNKEPLVYEEVHMSTRSYK